MRIIAANFANKYSVIIVLVVLFSTIYSSSLDFTVLQQQLREAVSKALYALEGCDAGEEPEHFAVTTLNT